MEYETIIGGSATATKTISWGGGCINTPPYTYTVSRPSSSTRTFVPRSLVESPKPKRDLASFKKIRLSGEIKMTPYSRSRHTTDRYLVAIPRRAVTLGWPSCSAGANSPKWVGDQVKLVLDYQEVGDLTYWQPKAVDTSGVSVLPSHQQFLNDLKAQVVQESYTSYDVLTDIAEIKDTFALLGRLLSAVRRPLQSFVDASRAIKKASGNTDKAHEAVGRLWMQYRYAIMPLFYSAADIVKTIEGLKTKYQTSRKSKTVTIPAVSDWDSSTYGPVEARKGLSIYQVVSATIRYGAVGKSRYDFSMSQARLFDKLGLNPFVTAWELIPFSFVVDWFVNIGDWVFSQTAGIVDFASQREFCTMVKENITADTYLRWNIDSEYRKNYPGLGDVVATYHDVGVGLLQRETFTNYTRQLFVPSDVTISSDIYLNWKRFVDGWVLSSKPLIHGLRSLR